MKQAFRLMSIFWVLSPLLFLVARLANIVNIDRQNSTIFLVLCGISYLAMFLNSDTQ